MKVAFRSLCSYLTERGQRTHALSQSKTQESSKSHEWVVFGAQGVGAEEGKSMGAVF